MKHIMLLAVLIMMATPSIVNAVEIRGIGVIGLTGGGDSFGTVVLSTGNNESIKAGGEFLMGVGVVFEGFLHGNFETQIDFGFHEDSVTASNGDVSFKRNYIEAIEFYRPSDNIRFGGGLSYYFAPEFKCSISGVSGCSDKLEFDDALGITLQADYIFVQPKMDFLLGLRYTSVSYDINKLNGIPASGSVDGNYIGLFGTIKFF